MTEDVRVVGRYALYGAIAAGGMATVHLGRLLGPVGFSRTVAIKRLHAQFASDPEFVSMFLDEARVAARIRHPNVVPTLDVVATGGELFLVMDYIPGESIARLSRVLTERHQTLPVRLLSATMAGALHGLHAAHEAKDERGHPLGIVHRDVSPQNVLVGTDGVARVLDFGVAKAAGRVQTTQEGQIKGKLSYMPPEQLCGEAVSRKTDIYAAGVMLWELVTGQRLFFGDNEGAIVARVLAGRVDAPSKALSLERRASMTDETLRILESLDATILRAIHMDPDMRFTTAREMAIEIERKCPPATTSEVGDWVETIARDVLHSRAAMVTEIESSASLLSVDGRQHVLSLLSSSPPTVARNSNLPTPFPALASGSDVQPAVSAFANGEGASDLSLRASGSVRPVHVSLPSDVVGSESAAALSSYSASGEGPPVTQLSTISVSAASPRLQRPNVWSGTTRRIVGGLIGASLIVSPLLYFRYKSHPVSQNEVTLSAPPGPVAEVVPATMPSTPSALPAVSAAPTTSALDVDPHDAGLPSPSSQVKRVTGGPRGGKKGVPVKSANPPPPPPPPSSTSSASDDCAVPYWYDESGVKKYKPKCLAK